MSLFCKIVAFKTLQRAKHYTLSFLLEQFYKNNETKTTSKNKNNLKKTNPQPQYENYIVKTC